MRIVFRLQDKNKAYIKFHLLLSPLWCWRKFIFWSINLTDLTRWHRGLASVTVSIVKNHSLSFHSIHVIAWSKIAWSKISCATKMLWFEVKYWNILFWGNYSGFSPSFSNKSTFFYTYIETIHTINFIHFKYIVPWVWAHVYNCVGFPDSDRGKEPTCQPRRRTRCGFDPWVGKIPWRRAWQPTLEFLPWESRGQRSSVLRRVHRVTKGQTWLKWLSMHVYNCVVTIAVKLWNILSHNQNTENIFHKHPRKFTWVFLW